MKVLCLFYLMIFLSKLSIHFFVLKCCSVCMIYSVSMVNYCNCEKDCYFVLKNYFSVEIIFKYCKLKVQNQFKRTEGKDIESLGIDLWMKPIEKILNLFWMITIIKKVAGLCKTAADCFLSLMVGASYMGNSRLVSCTNNSFAVDCKL